MAFHKKGVISTAGIIAEAISTHAVQAAPPTMAKLIALAAVSRAVTAGSPSLTLAKAALKHMAWQKAQFAVTATVAVLLVGGATLATLTKAKTVSPHPTGRITSSVTAATRSGRRITVAGDTQLGIVTEGDIATVMLGDQRVDGAGKLNAEHTLVIQTERVLLDGKERTTIPAATTAIEIISTNQTLSIAADKKLVLSANLDE
jgi:CBS domain-containing protein